MTELNLPTETQLREAYQQMKSKDAGELKTQMSQQDGIDESISEIFIKFGNQTLRR